MRLSLHVFTTGVETTGGARMVYDVGRGEASFGVARVEGRALVWQLDAGETGANGALLTHAVRLDPGCDWVMRCDRIDFPRGGIAHEHTHPGPGIRYLLHGELEVRTGGRSAFYGPGGAWFESGPEPVYAAASRHHETAFVRVLLLPAEWAGRRTIRYVDPGAERLPALQRATVLAEHELALR